VFAHEEDGDRGGDAAERPGVGAHVNVMPGPGVGQSCLEAVR
jgi:hypothetical protein